MRKAVLFITWNRLDETKQAFEAIRQAQPPKLYLASDGPRKGKTGEKEKIDKVRQWLLTHIDWPCEVKTRFLEKNSGGCGAGVSGAVTWLFENEPDGIILEDDCVASPSFFVLCEACLDKYKEDKRIWHIAGDNRYADSEAKESYYFSKLQHCWGWGSWADRWKHHSLDLSDYDEKNVELFSQNKDVQAYWLDILKKMKNCEIDTWDYQWTFIIVAAKGFCITPYKCLVCNIGDCGVHYSIGGPDLHKETYNLEKIIHPKEVMLNQKALDFEDTLCKKNNRSPFSEKEMDMDKVSCIKKSYYFFRVHSAL